ncbi:MAG: YitT family protein [Firmicutes bacterium]|nr:YitT family protein [Bacillota bacterium]
MKKITWNRESTTELIRFLLLTVAGAVLYAVSVNCFTAPNRIAPGGATGVATILQDVFGTPIGLMMLAVNLPLFLWGVLESGLRFFGKTIIATLIYSGVIDLSAPFLPQYRGDMMLAALFGGVISGAGLGLTFMTGATTGGSDLAAKLIGRRLRHISMGKLILVIDFLIVLASMAVYRNIESGLYAMITIFVCSRAVDTVLYGLDSGNGKLLFIMSQKSEEITREITSEMDRGVTMLRSKGGFTGSEGYALMCAVRRSEVFRLREIVRKIDPDAFLIIGNAEQIVGESFAPIDPEK